MVLNRPALQAPGNPIGLVGYAEACGIGRCHAIPERALNVTSESQEPVPRMAWSSGWMVHPVRREKGVGRRGAPPKPLTEKRLPMRGEPARATSGGPT